jgi:hypothetical protein
MSQQMEMMNKIRDCLGDRWKRQGLVCEAGRGKSKNIFYIYDPLLVILQRHKKTGKYAGNYRTGIYVQFVQKNLVYVGIKTEYCPQLFKNFQENTSTNQILITARKLFRHKEPVYLAWSSKWLAKKTMKRKHIHGGFFFTLSQIRSEFNLLDRDFIKDMGVTMPNTYNYTKASTGARGTHFELSVVLMSRPDIKKVLAVILSCEDLFLNFYPNSSRTARNDALRSKVDPNV